MNLSNCFELNGLIKFKEKISKVVKSYYKGSNIELVSLVFSKNKDVKSVQSIIKTDSIEIQDTPLVEGSTKKFTLYYKVFLYSFPHVAIISKMGFIVKPKSVREYSTFGGTSAYTFLEINPFSSISLKF